MNVRKLGNTRQTQKIKVLSPVSDSDDDAPELFTAQPSDDIPRNKLTEKLARGLQSFVQRMQKRESFYAELVLLDLPVQSWIPAPREYSTLSYCRDKAYLIGG
jgi:N-acetylneuraminic acid mutarotase